MDAEALANEDEELKKKIVMYYHPLVSYKFKLHSIRSNCNGFAYLNSFKVSCRNGSCCCSNSTTTG